MTFLFLNLHFILILFTQCTDQQNYLNTNFHSIQSKLSFSLPCSNVFVLDVSLKVFSLHLFPLKLLIHQCLTIVSVDPSFLYLPGTEGQLTLCRVQVLEDHQDRPSFWTSPGTRGSQHYPGHHITKRIVISF